eukprot:TRINITY_DN1489_c0_g1_i1.p1 TRINITY_DN1489_c0_g1~~TRINITY_DN1489_c0_g1_i1.p1  ORF type:complete len:415 (+),score=102.33 TRINITY_DN1489_c0_g1_i1:71-1315(+)
MDENVKILPNELLKYVYYLEKIPLHFKNQLCLQIEEEENDFCVLDCKYSKKISKDAIKQYKTTVLNNLITNKSYKDAFEGISRDFEKDNNQTYEFSLVQENFFYRVEISQLKFLQIPLLLRKSAQTIFAKKVCEKANSILIYTDKVNIYSSIFQFSAKIALNTNLPLIIVNPNANCLFPHFADFSDIKTFCFPAAIITSDITSISPIFKDQCSIFLVHPTHLPFQTLSKFSIFSNVLFTDEWLKFSIDFCDDLEFLNIDSFVHNICFLKFDDESLHSSSLKLEKEKVLENVLFKAIRNNDFKLITLLAEMDRCYVIGLQFPKLNFFLEELFQISLSIEDYIDIGVKNVLCPLIFENTEKLLELQREFGSIKVYFNYLNELNVDYCQRGLLLTVLFPDLVLLYFREKVCKNLEIL